MAAQMYESARSELPDEDPDAAFKDRSLRLATTFGGAGVIHGDLTPECAEVVGQVLDALGAPAGKEDDRSREERYHDALQEAMRRLVASNLLPERAGQPVKAWVHISLADLLLLDGDSALAGAVDRADPGAVGGVPGVRVRDRQRGRGLAGRRRRRGHRLRRRDGPRRHRGRERGRARRPGPALRRVGRPPRGGAATPPGMPSKKLSSARPSTCCPAPAGWPASYAAGSWAPASAAPACRWTSATARTSRPGSATR